MGIYTKNTVPYQRRTLLEMLVPYLMYTQRYDDIAEKIGNLGDLSVIWNNLLSPTRDPETWSTVNNYNLRLGDTVLDMQNGRINLNEAMNKLQNLKREYNEWGTAVDTAYKRRLQLIDELRKLELEGMHFTENANSLSIDDLIENPAWTYGSAKENDVYSHAYAGSQAASKRKISFRESKAFGDEYYKYTKIMGMSGAEAIRTIADLHDFPELELIYKRVKNGFELDRWNPGTSDREALDAMALSGILDGLTYDVDNNFYLNHSKIAEINHRYDKDKNTGKGSNGQDFYSLMGGVNDFVSGPYNGKDDNTVSESFKQSNELFTQLQGNAGSSEALFTGNDANSEEFVKSIGNGRYERSKYNGQPFVQKYEYDELGNPTSGYALSKDMMKYIFNMQSANDYINQFNEDYNNTLNNYSGNISSNAQSRYESWLDYNPKEMPTDAYSDPGIQKNYKGAKQPASIKLMDSNGEEKTYSYSDYANAKSIILKNQLKFNDALQVERQLLDKYDYLAADDDNSADILNKAYHLEYNINLNNSYVDKSLDMSQSDAKEFARSFVNRFGNGNIEKGDVGLFEIDNNGNISKNPTSVEISDSNSIDVDLPVIGSPSKHNYKVGYMISPKYKGLYLQIDKNKYVGKGDVNLDYANKALENYYKFFNDFSKESLTNNYIDLSNYNVTIDQLENNPEVSKYVFRADRQNRHSVDFNDGAFQYFVIKDKYGNYWKIITDNQYNIVGKLSVNDAITGNFTESNILRNEFLNMLLVNDVNGLRSDIKSSASN